MHNRTAVVKQKFKEEGKKMYNKKTAALFFALKKQCLTFWNWGSGGNIVSAFSRDPRDCSMFSVVELGLC